MSVKGRWEGKLVDSTGVTAAVEMDLVDNKGRLSGDFKVFFLSERGCGGRPIRRLAQTGEVKGSYSARRDTVRLAYEVTLGLKPVAVRLDARLTEAGNHARQAIVGCFTAEGDDELTLMGGGVVLWQYAGRRGG